MASFNAHCDCGRRTGRLAKGIFAADDDILVNFLFEALLLARCEEEAQAIALIAEGEQSDHGREKRPKNVHFVRKVLQNSDETRRLHERGKRHANLGFGMSTVRHTVLTWRFPYVQNSAALGCAGRTP